MWLEPLTGSSGMPFHGAKYRETKSYGLAGPPATQTLTPRISSAVWECCNAVVSGAIASSCACCMYGWMGGWADEWMDGGWWVVGGEYVVVQEVDYVQHGASESEIETRRRKR